MTLASEHVTRWVVVSVLGLATGAMFVISMRGNYLYGYSIGQSDEKRTLAPAPLARRDHWLHRMVAVLVLRA